MAGLTTNTGTNLTATVACNNEHSNHDEATDGASFMIDCLQQVIHRFSDHHDPAPNTTNHEDSKSFWTAPPSLRDIVHRYAPVGLESQFEQLYNLLHPCLVARDNEGNAAAFCLGHRGMGKGILVERCLQAFREECSSKRNCPIFRVVQVHGVLVPGNDVGLVVRDMLQQLSQAAYDERADIHNDTVQATPLTNNNGSDPHSRKRPKRTPRVEKLLRLRMSSFESNLQLLGETLKLARVDQIPILIVLDEVDAFLGTGSSSSGNTTSFSNNNSIHSTLEATKDRQLLLYHLLDRVATQGSNVCLVGISQQLNFRKQLEKRIKSRMEGTSKEILVGACPSMSQLISVLLSNFISDTPLFKELHEQMAHILTPSTDQHDDQASNSIQQRVWDALEREYRMGRNIRWFNRLFSFALSLYRGEWVQYQSRRRRGKDALKPQLEASHLMDALVAQGASISVELNTSSSRGDKQQRKRSLVIMGGNSHHPPTAVDSRIQALLDLSGPQVALVLAARRILARDAQWNGETASPPPLTLGRMLQEYGNFKANQQRYNRHLLWMSFQELMDQGLIRPAVDHTGGASFQYEHNTSYNSVNEAEDVPLHLLVDTNRELMEALQSGLLECSTALREWGRKTN